MALPWLVQRSSKDKFGIHSHQIYSHRFWIDQKLLAKLRGAYLYIQRWKKCEKFIQYIFTRISVQDNGYK